jgi:hypothetical protein
LADDVLNNGGIPFTQQELLQAFRAEKSGSVALLVQLFFFETYKTTLTCYLQGQREMKQYMDTDSSMQQLKTILGGIGATGVTGNGIVVKG